MEKHVSVDEFEALWDANPRFQAYMPPCRRRCVVLEDATYVIEALERDQPCQRTTPAVKQSLE